MRIATSVVLLSGAIGVLGGPTLEQVRRLAATPPELRVLPLGMRWLGTFGDPFPVALVAFGWGLLVVSLLAVVVGWYSRRAAGVAIVSSTYLFTLLYSFGKVDHGSMHLVWLLVLLTASPCDDAFAVRRTSDARGPLGYAVPVMAAWLLVVAIYLFPGAGKLAGAGLSWAWSDNLANAILEKRLELDWTGLLVFDTKRFAGLLRLGGVGALAFELLVVALLWRRRTRMLAAIAGLAFHLGTGWLMGIHFALPMTPLYIALLPLDPPFGTAPTPTAHSEDVSVLHSPADAAELGAGWTVQVLLVVAVWVLGATFVVDRWPISTYPLFAQVADDVFVQVVTLRDGEVVEPLPELGSGAAGRAVGRSLDDPAVRAVIEDDLGGPYTVCRVEWRLRDLSATVQHSVALTGSGDCGDLVGNRRAADTD